MGISQIVTKCRGCHEFEKLVGRLTPSIQAKGKIELIQQLQPMYFPKVKLEEVPGYDVPAEDLAEAAFQSFQHDPIEFHILLELEAKPDMSTEEIGRVKEPNLLSDQAKE